jgi:hypothetical protein
MKAMRQGVKGDYSAGGGMGRGAIANEVEKRVDAPVFDEARGWHGWTKRLMTVSFLDKLFSPAYNVVNSLQPAMVTMPTLAGRHGVARSFTEMRRAYSDIGGLSIVKKGLADTYTKIKNGETTGFLDDIRSRLANDRERDAFRHLAEVGSISPDSGLEVADLIKAHKGVGGKIDTGLGYLEGIARQMPRAIEAINRAATGLAAYRLEFAKTGDHAKSMRYAQETINNTHFLYSTTNRPALFNHPLAKLALQFKQYGQGMYHLIGMNIGRSLHGLTAAERAEAVKTLAGIAATHVALAGALGLPTEPFKYLLMGLKAAGVTSTGWDDVEDKARKIGAAMFGKLGGEVATKGLPRLLGIDLSSRVGLDSLTSFGEPKTDKEADVKKWLFDTLAGAPVALVGDWVKGANALMTGDFTKAAEQMVPVKFAADSIRAYRQFTEGKKSATSQRETMSPYTPREAAMRALGFTPAREAETGAERSSFYGKQTKAKEERSALMAKWVVAKSADKRDAYAAVQKWNRSHPSQEEIKMSELESARKRRDTEDRSGVMQHGIRTTKRDRYLLENSPYNAQ